jgi:small-conductance mechanosensitive channel
MEMVAWITENWLAVVIPVVVFLAFFVVGLSVRRIVFKALSKLWDKVKWKEGQLFNQIIRAPFLHWWLIVGALVAIAITALPSTSKALAAKVLGSLFAISLTWVIITLSEKLIRLYLGKLKVTSTQMNLAVNIVRITIVVVGILVLLDIWGAPTTPVILVLAAAILVAILAGRNLILDIFSGFELARSDLVKTGDYIKLDTGEEGYVEDISWRSTRIKALDDSAIVVPNHKLTQATVTNYGRPLKKAAQPFRFYTHLHLKELTGLKASNLSALAEMLREIPDSVVYYHTHHFMEEHQFLTPEPANDFAVWVGDAIGDDLLAEKLASIDTFEFPHIGALRARIVAVINEHLVKTPNGRTAPVGREFHFVKSISVVLPTVYIAHDLREFIQVLQRVAIDSLFFHVFDSRLRLQKGTNDFSIWLRECLGEDDLADKIARLDPYNYTLEGLRSAIIQLIEKRIK